MKVYIDGRDNMGWAIDENRKNLLSSLLRLGIENTENLNDANIVHNIWWSNPLEDYKYFKFYYYHYLKNRKNYLLSAFDYINLNDPNYVLQKRFEKLKKIAYAWIVQSSKQKVILEENNIRCYYQPHFVNLDIFKPLTNIKKEKIFEKFNIPEDLFLNKIVIGSIQRDSLGADITKPKWQKGPELLIELVKELPKDKFILLLSGPRRHYVINQCKKYNIPYWYSGVETITDDIKVNYLGIEEINELYSLIDLYLVTSKSEGGPHAVIEATATKTFILSTDVGLAADFINKDFVFTDVEMFKHTLLYFINNFKDRKKIITNIVEEQFLNCMKIMNQNIMDKRLMDIYKDVLKEKSK